MTPSDQPVPQASGNQTAKQHVSEAQQILQSLQEELGKHPQLEEAIEKLELALSALTIQTGGLI